MLSSAALICGINAFTSLLAGLVVFGSLGHLAFEQQVPVDSVVESGPELVFIAYPSALRLFSAPNVFSVLFFAMFLLVAIDSVYTSIETIASALEETLAWHPFVKQHLSGKQHRWKLAAMLCLLLFLCGLFFSTGAGAHWVGFFDHYVPLFVLFVLCACELLAISWYADVQLFAWAARLGSPLDRRWLYFWR